MTVFLFSGLLGLHGQPFPRRRWPYRDQTGVRRETTQERGHRGGMDGDRNVINVHESYTPLPP